MNKEQSQKLKSSIGGARGVTLIVVAKSKLNRETNTLLIDCF